MVEDTFWLRINSATIHNNQAETRQYIREYSGIYRSEQFHFVNRFIKINRINYKKREVDFSGLVNETLENLAFYE